MMTFRGMVVNDLQCCHLSTDCLQFRNYVAEVERQTSSGFSRPIGFDDFNETAYANDPYYCFDAAERDVKYSGDGNLGRYYLTQLDFQQITKFDTMWILLFAAVGLRVLAIGTFLFWEWKSHRLIERESNTQYMKRSSSWSNDNKLAVLPPARSPSISSRPQQAPASSMKRGVVAATSVFGVPSSYADVGEDDDDLYEEEPLTPSSPIVGGSYRDIEMQSLMG